MHIEEHISLKDQTTLKIGGVARYFVSVGRVEELVEAIQFAKEKQVPFFVLGGGSNVLVADKAIDALCIKLDILGIERQEKGDSVLVIAGAGEKWDGLVEAAVERGWWGIENLSGIPGTVGAAPIQNIGAYGAELKDVLEWVEVFGPKGSTFQSERFNLSDCRFAYRDSFFKRPEGKHLIITRVALRLYRKGTPNFAYKDLQKNFAGNKTPSLYEIRRAVLDIRSKKFPDLRKFGTAGSFFKNPVISRRKFGELKKRFPNLPGFELRIKDKGLRIKIPLAWILDNVCGLKGYAKGNVGLFEHQPIVLVNKGLASGEEISLFAKEVITSVKEKTGIEVEWEVQKIS